MTQPIPMIELWRGPILESAHLGHAVVCNGAGEIVDCWGDPDLTMLPRSSCKMIQALPLITSGAAKRFGLRQDQLALSCASHQGAAIHTDRVTAWLSDLDLGADDLRCGPQEPADIPARDGLIRDGAAPCRIHNNCSGKHCGFLTLAQHLGAGPEYHEVDHPVQQAARAAFEEVTQEPTRGHGIDGCSAPNFATSLHGLARAMGQFATAHHRSGALAEAQVALTRAMIAHPELVAGETRACTELMRAAPNVALKVGAEAVYTAILPDQGLGIALKIVDGGVRAAEAAIVHLLSRYDAIDPAHPLARKRINGPILNWDGLETGMTKPAASFS